MSKPGFIRSIQALALMVLLAGAGWAAVTSQPVNLSGQRGFPVYIALKLTATDRVAGVNGQLDYDTRYFTNPSVQAGAGAATFTAMGNMVSPGHFRFVLYADPTAQMDIRYPVAYFRLEIPYTFEESAYSFMNYSLAAAGDTSARALGATFSGIQVRVSGNAVDNWALYE